MDEGLGKFNTLVRPLVTVMFAGTACYLAIIRVVSVEAFLGLVGVVLAWWNESRKQKEG